jgi:hypothetical protein
MVGFVVLVQDDHRRVQVHLLAVLEKGRMLFFDIIGSEHLA